MSLDNDKQKHGQRVKKSDAGGKAVPMPASRNLLLCSVNQIQISTAWIAANGQGPACAITPGAVSKCDAAPMA